MVVLSNMNSTDAPFCFVLLWVWARQDSSHHSLCTNEDCILLAWMSFAVLACVNLHECIVCVLLCETQGFVKRFSASSSNFLSFIYFGSPTFHCSHLFPGCCYHRDSITVRAWLVQLSQQNYYVLFTASWSRLSVGFCGEYIPVACTFIPPVSKKRWVSWSWSVLPC